MITFRHDVVVFTCGLNCGRNNEKQKWIECNLKLSLHHYPHRLDVDVDHDVYEEEEEEEKKDVVTLLLYVLEYYAERRSRRRCRRT